MNVPAALAVQSIPFAWLVLSSHRDNADLFAVLYIAGLGLLLSLIVWLGDQLIFDQVMAAVGDFD